VVLDGVRVIWIGYGGSVLGGFERGVGQAIGQSEARFGRKCWLLSRKVRELGWLRWQVEVGLARRKRARAIERPILR
jgi:hypothetical protein